MWLHVPRSFLPPTSASAPEAEDSTLDYALLGLELEHSATWRETSLKPQSWRRVLKSAGFLTRLSGLTCSRSEAESGVGLWMASWAESRANLTLTPANDWAHAMNGTSGLSLRGWYTTLRQRGASLRTSQGFWATTTTKSDQAYEDWATTLRRASSRRRRSARHIFGSASSGWPSPQTADGERASETLFRGEGNPTLLGEARNWPGVTAKDATNRAYQRDGGEKGKERLTLAGEARSQNWPTPSTAPEAPNANSNQKSSPPSQGLAAELWQTPSVADTTDGHMSRGGERADELLLGGQAKAWTTPTVDDAHQGVNARQSGAFASLTREVAQWPTAQARDWKGDSEGRLLKDKHQPGGPRLPGMAQLSHQALAMQLDGLDGSPSGRVLNPAFVEMLMGWPAGLTDYASSETASYLWRRRMRSCLSLLGWEVSES